jgi:hypothetical protein
VDCPNVIDDRGSRRDAPTFVSVFFQGGVRNAQDDGRHPAYRFLDASPHTWEILVVLDRWKAVWANNSIDLFLYLFLHVWPDDAS